jgi:hypothetical protein
MYILLVRLMLADFVIPPLSMRHGMGLSGKMSIDNVVDRFRETDR